MSTFARIRFALNTLLASNDSFTILDITNAVNADGGDEVRHRDVRSYAKPFLDDIVVGRGYDVTLIAVTDVHGNLAQAALYYPDNVDPMSYQNRQKSIKYASSTQSAGSSCAVAPAAQKVAPVVATHITNARASRTVKVRMDGGIEIPQAILEEAGMSEGDEILVVQHPNSISVVLGDSTRLVNTNGVRVSKTMLAKSNLTGSMLSVCAFSDKVLISK